MQTSYPPKSPREYGETEITNIAKDLAEFIKQGYQYIFFSGPTGAGKTTLIKEVLSQFDIPKRQVKSPTFAIKKTYYGSKKVFHHLDLHRLNQVNVSELLEDHHVDHIYLIEWGEKISKTINNKALLVTLTYCNNPELRELTIEYL